MAKIDDVLENISFYIDTEKGFGKISKTPTKQALYKDMLELIEQVAPFKIVDLNLPDLYDEGYADGKIQTAQKLRTKLKKYFGIDNG